MSRLALLLRLSIIEHELRDIAASSGDDTIARVATYAARVIRLASQRRLR